MIEQYKLENWADDFGLALLGVAKGTNSSFDSILEMSPKRFKSILNINSRWNELERKEAEKSRTKK